MKTTIEIPTSKVIFSAICLIIVGIIIFCNRNSETLICYALALLTCILICMVPMKNGESKFACLYFLFAFFFYKLDVNNYLAHFAGVEAWLSSTIQLQKALAIFAKYLTCLIAVCMIAVPFEIKDKREETIAQNG